MSPQEHQNRTPANAPAVAEPADGRLIEFDEFIDAKLRKTRSHVRSVDFATSLMLLATGTLLYILLAAAFDHWIVPGGLGFWSRTAFLVIFLLGAGAYLTTTLVPLVVRNINPLYAAETIERSQPSLKNGLVNFLFFRDRPERLNPAIYQAVEEQAARNLASASSDAAVDRTRLIRVGYVLAGILLVAAIYALVSPKNLFRTVGRIAVPWAEIDAPTRTTIDEIEPRDAQAFRGQQIEVRARIRDLPDDAPARLIYTTADGQTVDRALEMQLDDDGYQHVCLLPGDNATLQQDLEYRIAAGDAVTRPFRLDVVAAPTIFVESVETKYPAYTGLLAQRVERQGDIKAIEGSEITIEAVANELIQAAHVDFDCDGTLDQRMSTNGDRAKVSFKLILRDDRRTPKHSSYQLVFTNQRDQRNPQPVRHQIEVTRDVSPEIAIVAPTQDPFDVPAGGWATLEVVANDPDFALGLVKISIAQGEKPLADKLLLSEPHRGQFVGKYRFEPKPLGLKPGDTVTYSALAEDNKSPNPNRAETVKKTLRITAAGDRGQQDQLAENDPAKNDQSQAGDSSQGDRQQNQADDKSPSKENGAGEQGEQSPENSEQPAEGEEGAAEKSASRGGGKQSPDREPADQQPGDKTQPQDQQQGKSQQNQPGEEQSKPGDQQQGENQSDSQAGGGAGQQSKSSASGQKNSQQNKSGESGGDSANQQETPVANDGSNDGDAMERILKHRDQQQSGDGGKSPSSQPSQQKESSKDKSQEQNSLQTEGDSAGEQRKGSRDDKSQQQSPSDSDAKQDGDAKAGEQRDAGQQGGDEKKSGAQGDGDDGKSDKSSPAGKRQTGQQNRSGEKSGEQQAGEADSDNTEKGDQPSGEHQQGKAADDAKRDQQSGKPADEKPGDDASKSDGAGEQQDAKQGRPADASQKSSGNDQRGKAKSDDAQSAGKQAGEKQDANDQQPGEGQSDKQKPADEGQGREQSQEGQGAKTKSDPMGNQNETSKDAEQSDAKGGDGEQSKGKSGAGQKSSDKQGSPSPQKDSKPRDKSQSPSQDDQESKDPNQAQSPSQNKNESDSQGQDDGDRSGGGKRGGGQKANKAGTGGAGQNTAADEGAGASEQKGDGETSNRAGDDQKAKGQTGKSGNERGKGSQSQQAASKDGEQSPSGDDSENSAKGETSPEGARDGQSSSGGGTPTGGNTNSKSDDSTPAEQPYRTAPEVADEANLEFAREASDLALSHLKDELAKDQPDANLLKDLGWSRDDLQRFVSRWEQMRQDAEASGTKGETARRELDDTLKSLGLRPRATSLKENSARDDAVRGMRESRRSSPPAEYAEQVKAYSQGTARGGK